MKFDAGDIHLRQRYYNHDYVKDYTKSLSVLDSLKKMDTKILYKSLKYPKIIIGVTLILFFASVALSMKMGRDFLPKHRLYVAEVYLLLINTSTKQE